MRARLSARQVGKRMGGGLTMRKVIADCPYCGSTTHREKKVSKRKSGYRESKRSVKTGFGTYSLLLKCMTCGHLHGSALVKRKKVKHVKIGK